MVSLSALWLPILLSAVFVFIASNILWMAIPFWHRWEYGKLPDEAAALAAFSKAPSGQYMVPFCDWNKMTPEQKAEMEKGPMATIMLRNPMSSFSFPVALISYFLYTLVISFFVAYLAGCTLAAGTPYLRVFRIAGTAGFMAYAFGTIPYSIWYGKPWSVTLKYIVDAVIYGLLIAGTFGWLWPK